MRILAIDSSAKTATAALLTDGSVTASFTVQTGTHSTTLLPMIEDMLTLSSLTYGDIDAYAAVCGPGSFTGIRIGVSTVKGLAFSANVPCIGVSALDAMAENLRGVDGIIVPVIDARRDMVYTAVYRSTPDGQLTKLCDDSQLSVDELCGILNEKYEDERVFFAGDAYGTMTSHPLRPKLTAYTPDVLRLPSAVGAALSAQHKWDAAEDRSVFTDSSLLPVYLKKSQAERERDERISGTSD